MFKADARAGFPANTAQSLGSKNAKGRPPGTVSEATVCIGRPFSPTVPVSGPTPHRHIAAWAAKTGHEAIPNGIGNRREDYRDEACHVLAASAPGGQRHEDIDLLTSKLRRHVSRAHRFALRTSDTPREYSAPQRNQVRAAPVESSHGTAKRSAAEIAYSRHLSCLLRLTANARRGGTRDSARKRRRDSGYEM